MWVKGPYGFLIWLYKGDVLPHCHGIICDPKYFIWCNTDGGSEEVVPLSPPKEKEVVPLSPPKEKEVLPLSPPKEKEVLPLSPPKEKEVVPLSPPKEKEVLPLSPPKEKEVLPLSPPKEKEVLPLSPPQKEKEKEGVSESPAPPEVGYLLDSPKIINGNFSYTIESNFGENYYSGRTSRQNFILESSVELITVISFDSNNMAEAENLTDAMKVFQNRSRVLNFFYLNTDVIYNDISSGRCHVIIDWIERDYEMFAIEIFSKKHRGPKDWLFCRQAFEILFEGICVALAQIFCHPEGHYSVPSLIDAGTIAIDNKGTPRIAFIKKLKVGSSNRSIEMNDLGDAMINFLTRGGGDKTVHTAWDSKLRALRVPEDVIDFIRQCKERTPLSNVPVEWVLDYPGLWSWENLKDWVYMASDIVYEWLDVAQVGVELDTILKNKLQGRKWESFIPLNGRIGVLRADHLNRVMISHDSRFDCIFFVILRFYRNVVEHFDNDVHVSQWIGKIEVCKMMESFFDGGLCCMLRDALQVLLFENYQGPRPIGMFWDRMLSRDMLESLNSKFD